MRHCELSVSIIVIGYNTKHSLLSLLQTINQQKTFKEHLIEVVYVDDGSSDDSFLFFQKFDLKYMKQAYKLQKNCGRSVATQKGIDLAQYSWLYFVRSNETLQENTLQEFISSIQAVNAIAFMGRIQYTSKDVCFEKYLNHKKRGINHYKNHALIHYKYLLFGNCMIASRVFKKIRLNKHFRYYGGEELDFSEKISTIYQKNIRACVGALVLRHNHPGFLIHCQRMEAFGEKNFHYLNKQNQKHLVGFGYYLMKLNFLFSFWSFLALVSKKTYTYNLGIVSFYIFRVGLFSSLMKGAVKPMRAQNFQTPNLPS